MSTAVAPLAVVDATTSAVFAAYSTISITRKICCRLRQHGSVCHQLHLLPHVPTDLVLNPFQVVAKAICRPYGHVARQEGQGRLASGPGGHGSLGFWAAGLSLRAGG